MSLLPQLKDQSPMKAHPIYVCLALGGVSLGIAQQLARAGDEAPASQEENAIRAADLAFMQDYSKGDAKALAARFTEDAEVIQSNGARFQGRALIEQRLAETFAACPGVTLEITPESIRFLSPDVVKEEGRTMLKPTQGAPEVRQHTALLVRKNGQWLISSIREETETLLPPHERLKELDWMIGEWVDEGPDAHIHVSCHWSKDGNFLIRTFAVKVQGKPALSIHQRVGWDPLAKQFRSWEFDSEGGFGEGKWSGGGDRWVIKHTGVRPEGITASATHNIFRERPDLVRWSSVDRVVGDESVASQESYAMVRVPPTPKIPAAVQPVPSPTPRETRTP